MSVLPVSSGRRTVRTVLAHVRRHRLLATGAVSALVAAAAIGLLIPPLLGSIVDRAIAGDGAAIGVRVLLLLIVALVEALLTYAGLVAVGTLGEYVLAGLREDFVVHALRVPLDRIEAGGSGDLISRITEDVALVSEAIRSGVPRFLRAALIVVLSVVGLSILDWRFGVAALVAAPIQAVATRWYMRRSKPLYRSQREATGAEAQQFLESIGGAATVRAFGLSDEHVRLARQRVTYRIGYMVDATHLLTRFFGRLAAAEAIGLIAVLVTGAFLVEHDVVTVGTASAAALYFVNIFVPLSAVLYLLDTLQSATVSLARVVGVSEVEGASPGGGATPRDGSVEAAGLRFSYVEGHDVLRDVDLVVPAGTTVALVGESGGGKTTLASVLAGLRPPAAGTVQLGGASLVSLDAPERAVVLVTQELHVFAGPLAEDLRLAAPAASDRELADALELVGASEWVARLPAGVDTVVGDGGYPLTPEQIQQVALARVVLADPLVVILDEATAEAGSTGARSLDAAAVRVLDGRTGIVVAHRLSQAAAADQVVLLEQGRVVEHGTHAELVAAGGRYARLWASWTAGRS